MILSNKQNGAPGALSQTGLDLPGTSSSGVRRGTLGTPGLDLVGLGNKISKANRPRPVEAKGKAPAHAGHTSTAVALGNDGRAQGCPRAPGAPA